MQTTATSVVVSEMFFAQKFGLNLSEMEVRTFLRIKKVIWDQLLAFQARVSCIQLYATFLNKLRLELQSVFLIVCSPPRSFFRLNHLRLVRKRLTHPTFSSRTIIQRLFYQNAACSYSHVLPLLRATISSFGYASGGRCAKR